MQEEILALLKRGYQALPRATGHHQGDVRGERGVAYARARKL